MNDTKAIFLVVAGVVGVVLVDMLMNPGKRLLVLGGTREDYYGGSGRCFRTSDDAEVSASRCTDRGIDIGGVGGSGLGAGLAAAAKGIASSFGGLFGGGASVSEDTRAPVDPYADADPWAW